MPERLECCFADEIVVFPFFGTDTQVSWRGLLKSFESDVTAGQMSNEVEIQEARLFAVLQSACRSFSFRFWSYMSQCWPDFVSVLVAFRYLEYPNTQETPT